MNGRFTNHLSFFFHDNLFPGVESALLKVRPEADAVKLSSVSSVAVRSISGETSNWLPFSWLEGGPTCPRMRSINGTLPTSTGGENSEVREPFSERLSLTGVEDAPCPADGLLANASLSVVTKTIFETDKIWWNP
jgi:hypothetical protein